MKLYSITNWGKHYETHETKKLVALKWVPFPNKHDGLTFRKLGTERDSAALFGAWVLIAQIASKSDSGDRGRLIRNGNPMTARDMALVTGFPEKDFQRALDYFTQPAIGWMNVEIYQLDLPLSPENPAEIGQNLPLYGREGKGIEGKGKKEVGRAAVAAPASDSEWLAELGSSEAYRGINVATEFAKMRVWCGVHKKPASKQRFVAWLNRAEKPMQATAAYRPAPADGPRNWRATLKRLYPETTYDAAWGSLPESTRREIQLESQ